MKTAKAAIWKEIDDFRASGGSFSCFCSPTHDEVNLFSRVLADNRLDSETSRSLRTTTLGNLEESLSPLKETLSGQIEELVRKHFPRFRQASDSGLSHEIESLDRVHAQELLKRYLDGTDEDIHNTCDSLLLEKFGSREEVERFRNSESSKKERSLWRYRLHYHLSDTDYRMSDERLIIEIGYAYGCTYKYDYRKNHLIFADEFSAYFTAGEPSFEDVLDFIDLSINLAKDRIYDPLTDEAKAGFLRFAAKELSTSSATEELDPQKLIADILEKVSEEEQIIFRDALVSSRQPGSCL